MQRFTSMIGAGLLAFAGFSQAASYTPESGFWWNPAEPGTGLAIEIEDDFAFVAAYMYDAQGFPLWYLGGGYLTDTNNTLRLTVQTNTFQNGQCLGCVWRAPSTVPAGGTMTITFDNTDETRATLNWGGVIKNIRRQDYYEINYGSDSENQRLLGEWQIVIDYSSAGGNFAAYPFRGDVLAFYRIVNTQTGRGVDGCRTANISQGFCSTQQVAAHDAFAVFNSVDQLFLITVTDFRASGQTTEFLHYIVQQRNFNVSDFRGVVVPALQGQNPFNLPSYPVAGYRSASRKYVQDGTGPSAVDKSAQSTAGMLSQLRAMNGGTELAGGLTDEELERDYGLTRAQIGNLILKAQEEFLARKQ